MRKKNKEASSLHNYKLNIGDIVTDMSYPTKQKTYPCHNCKDRKLGCHATCKRYKESKRGK